MRVQKKKQSVAPLSKQGSGPSHSSHQSLQLKGMSYAEGARALSPQVQKKDEESTAGGEDSSGGGFLATGGSVSDVSWGETAGLYPTAGGNLYNPSRWDQGLVGELLKARAAIHLVGNERNPKVHRSMPSRNALEQKLAAYHYTENFPAVDPEIASDEAVKYFYLSADPNAKHTGITGGIKVKHYGPFHNVGGGDAGGSSIYLIFYKA